MDDEVQRWAIIIFGATAASLGLASRFKMTEKARDLCAAVTYVCVGMALILGQV